MTKDEYAAYLKTEGWKRRRKYALVFWGYKCALCYSDKNIQVHHRTYIRVGHEYLSDLIALCDGCHERHSQFIKKPDGQLSPDELAELWIVASVAEII